MFFVHVWLKISRLATAQITCETFHDNVRCVCLTRIERAIAFDMYAVVLRVIQGNLTNHDEDGNENATKQGLMSKTIVVHVRYISLHIS